MREQCKGYLFQGRFFSAERFLNKGQGLDPNPGDKVCALLPVRFTPDFYLEDGDRLTEYGLDVTILHVPGHSAGSIAVWTDDGAFFSGDFLENRTRPSIATLVDDAEALKASFERVKKLDIRIVYPGHGKAFTMDEVG
ncbi:MAG: MBL fold metallo-hydrolase [Candidatus Bipolaricaulota bacterium]|nr:MBL fold metallo-hydrolase [Candidatus Bipolaricaulota bacterium]